MFESGRDELLQGLVRQFLDCRRAKIVSVFCLCPSIEFAQENNSVLDFYNVPKLPDYFLITKIGIKTHKFLDLLDCLTIGDKAISLQ